MAVAQSACAGSLLVRTGETGTKTFAPAGCAGNNGQRQNDPREPGYRYPTRRQAFLLSRGLGAAFAAGVSGPHRLRGGGTDHSLELSASHAGVEDRTRSGNGKYSRPEAS